MTSVLLIAWLSTSAQVPDSWTCPAEQYADSLCDCGCNVVDADCPDTYFSVCERDNCPNGYSPWEHDNYACMRSSCGDGWRTAFEACDDFDALNSGGCNADCTAVNEGYTCGERAEGCAPIPGYVFTVDAGPEPDAGDGATPPSDAGNPTPADAGAEETPQNPACTSTGTAPGPLLGLLLLLACGRRRPRWRRPHQRDATSQR